MIQSWDEQRELQIQGLIEGWTTHASHGRWFLEIEDMTTETYMPEAMANLLHAALMREHLSGDEVFNETPIDLYIKFRCTGYYNYANNDGNDDREMISVRFVYGDDEHEIRLTDEEQGLIFDHYESYVNDLDLAL